MNILFPKSEKKIAGSTKFTNSNPASLSLSLRLTSSPIDKDRRAALLSSPVNVRRTSASPQS